MNNLRATYDQKIIDAWSAQLKRRSRTYGKAYVVLFLVIVALLACAFILHSSFAVVAIFPVGLVLALLQVADRQTLLCPNCNNSPISKMQRGTANGADFCVHCHYWLVSPYACHLPGA